MSNTLINSVKTPIEAQKQLVKKERGDVTRSLNSIEGTLKGILDKEEKITNSTNKALKKDYKSQIKDSNKYLNKLFKTLKTEMIQAISAERTLYRMGGKDNG